MACLNPYSSKVFDYRLGKMVSIQIPCGRCSNCLASFRRGWEFRIRQTAEKQKKGFIYDTLTISDEHMPFMDYSEIKEDGIIYYPGVYFEDGFPRTRTLTSDVVSILEHYDFKLPYFPRSFLSRWIKLGRERYKKATGRRLKLRYAIVLEYGPKWSRPHMHCMFFDISYEDYVKYFAEPWRALFGFTKTKFISSLKDCSKVASYLSKYFTKGDFSSPLVKCGLLPKEWRLLSHGIGIEYLKSSRLSSLASYLALPPRLFELAKNTSVDSEDKVLVENLCNMVDLALTDLSHSDLCSLVDRVSTAYIGSYPLSLPRFYKDKLLSSNFKSCLYVILSHHLRTFSDKHRFKKLSEFVAGRTHKSLEDVECLFENRVLSFAYWTAQFASFQKEQALVQRTRRKVLDRNFYSQPLRNLNFDELCL